MSYDPRRHFDAAKYTLRALLTVHENAIVFDEEPPDVDRDGHNSWATRIRFPNGDTELSWHIVCDEDGLVDISRSVSFLTSDDEPVNHTALIKQVDLAETGFNMFSSIITQLIIGKPSVPMRSRKEAEEWRRTAQENVRYIFRTGINRLIMQPNRGDSVLWAHRDESERFALIQDAAERQVGHALGGHKDMWVQAGVVFDSHDVYSDAWYDEAGRLMGTLS